MVQPISEMRQSGLLPPEEPPVSDMTTSAYDLAQEQIGSVFTEEAPPEKFGIEQTYNNLIQGVGSDGEPLDSGPYSENDALDAIAQHLLVRDGYDPETAKQKVKSRERLPEDIILDLTPTKDRSPVGAFFEGLAREGAASFVGIEAAALATPPVYAGSQPTRAVPLVGPVLPEAIGLTTAVSTYLLASGATQEVVDFLVPEAPYLPPDVSYRKAGEAFGAGVGAVRRSKDILLALPQQIELGSSRILNNISQNKILGTLQKAYGRVARTLEQGIPALRREALESPELITRTEAVTIPGVAVAAGVAEQMDPGDTSTAILSEMAGSIVNIPRIVTGSLGLLNKAKEAVILGLGPKLGGFGGDRAIEIQNQRAGEWLVGFLDEIGKISGQIQPDLLVDYSKQNPFFGPDGQAFDFENFVAGYRTPEGAFDSQNFFEELGQQGLVDSTGQAISVDEVLRNSGAAGEFDARSVLEYLQNNQIIGVDGQPIEGLELMVSDLVPEAARPAMRALENSFIVASGRLSGEVADANRRSLQGLSAAIQTLEATGNPNALRAAAELRNNMYQVLLQGRVEARINKAIETAQKATGDAGFDARAFVGQEIKRITEEALLDARALEKAMYGNVDFDTPVDIDNFFQRYLEIEGKDLLPEEIVELDLITRQVFERLTENPKAAQLEEIGATAANLGNQRRAALLEVSKADKAIEGILNKSPELETQFLELRETLESPMSSLAPTSPERGQIELVAEGFSELSELEQLQRMRGVANTKGSDFSQLKPLIDRRIDSLTKRQTAEGLSEEILNLDITYSGEFAGPVSQPARLQDLQRLRSRLLDAARNQDQGTNFRRIYGELAEAIRDDISVLADGVEARELAGETLSKNEKTLLEAHRFSKSFNDVFRRTFASDVLDQTASGAPRIPAEELADRLYTGSVGRVNRLFDSLKEAARFLGDQGAEEAAKRATSIDEAYGILLKTLANRVLKPRMVVKPNGQRVQEMVVDQAALRNLTNPETPLGSLLQRPELAALRQDLTVLGPDGKPVDDVLLEAGRTANLLLSYRQGRRGPLTNSQESVRHSLLADILNVDSPVRLVDRALSDPDNPAKAFKNLVGQLDRLGARAVLTPRQRATLQKLNIDPDVKGIPPAQLINEAKQGFRSSVFYWAFGSGQTADGFISPAKVRQALFEPVGKDQPTVAKMMVDDGIITQDEIGRLDNLLTRMANVEQRYQRGASLEELMDDDSAVTNFTLRVIGARMAGQFVPGQGGQIQVPAAGASLMQQMFGKMPMLGTRNVITEAIKPGNEKVFASLLRRGLNKPENAARNQETMQAIDAFLVRTLGMSPVTGAVVAQELRPFDRPAEREFISPIQDKTPQVREAEKNREASLARQRADRERFMEARRREAQQQAPPPQPAPVVAPPQASLAPQTNPQSLQRAVQVLGMDDEIGGLASEMLMRQRPS